MATVTQLQDIARTRGIRGFSRLKKDDLILVLEQSLLNQANTSPETVMTEMSLPEQHASFKQAMTQILWREANSRNLCGQFDRVMQTIGLPRRMEARYEHADTDNIVGEETVEEFERWKRKANRILARACRRQDFAPRDIQRVFAECGLVTLERVTVTVTGTFTVPVTAWRLGDEILYEGDVYYNHDGDPEPQFTRELKMNAVSQAITQNRLVENAVTVIGEVLPDAVVVPTPVTERVSALSTDAF